MTIDLWAKKHNISNEALIELKFMMGIDAPYIKPELPEKTEQDVMHNIRVVATRLGRRLWRNNVGAYSEKNPPTPGTRWGLVNESAKMNKLLKSSDLIGITPIHVTPEMVGTIVGVFTAYEVKRPMWNFKGTDKENAQLRFIELVLKLGGIARFINSSKEIK